MRGSQRENLLETVCKRTTKGFAYSVAADLQHRYILCLSIKWRQTSRNPKSCSWMMGAPSIKCLAIRSNVSKDSCWPVWSRIIEKKEIRTSPSLSIATAVWSNMVLDYLRTNKLYLPISVNRAAVQEGIPVLRNWRRYCMRDCLRRIECWMYTLYNVLRDMLSRRTSPKLSELLSEHLRKGTLGINEPIFIDRNGRLFEYGLDYLRTNKLNLPFSASRGKRWIHILRNLHEHISPDAAWCY